MTYINDVQSTGFWELCCRKLSSCLMETMKVELSLLQSFQLWVMRYLAFSVFQVWMMLHKGDRFWVCFDWIRSTCSRYCWLHVYKPSPCNSFLSIGTIVLCQYGEGDNAFKDNASPVPESELWLVNDSSTNFVPLCHFLSLRRANDLILARGPRGKSYRKGLLHEKEENLGTLGLFSCLGDIVWGCDVWSYGYYFVTMRQKPRASKNIDSIHLLLQLPTLAMNILLYETVRFP